MEAHLIKIRIIGACGSGKSYIARQLSQKYAVPYYELDNLVWDRSHPNRRNPVEIRDAQLNEILQQPAWIIEGVHHKWGQDSFKQADRIFIINPNKIHRDYRVIRRFIRTRLGMEQGNYKQTYRNLYQMLFVWNRGFDQKSLTEIMELTDPYAAKRIVVKSNNDILKQKITNI